MNINRRRALPWANTNHAASQFFSVRPPWQSLTNLPQWLLPRPSLCGPPDLPLNNSHRLHPSVTTFHFSPPPNQSSHIIGRGGIGHRRPSFIRSPRKRIHPGNRPYGRGQKRKRAFSDNSKLMLNPNDPLNLQDLMKETERRRVEGLSPLRGDSRLNTPALINAGDLGGVSPTVLPVQKNDVNTSSGFAKSLSDSRGRGSLHGTRRNIPNRRFSRRIPITGNYPDYYSRRDPYERLQYLMPEWFSGKDVADYGCHNGTMTFLILERFHDTRRIDAFDCDSDLIANARCMQRERIRWETNSSLSYDKIHFQVSDWVDATSACIDEPEYDTILAFSVTKWIHLNHGDAGLMRFFRRAFNLLKPGGHLILEPQPMSSYRRTRFSATQHANFKSINIDPSKLEPLLVDLGFSYFDAIKIPHPNQPFQRHIMLCSKSYGATPASIRNDFRNEAQHWLSPSPSALSPVVREPPPVNYCPQTPNYGLTISPTMAAHPVTGQSLVNIASSAAMSAPSVADSAVSSTASIIAALSPRLPLSVAYSSLSRVSLSNVSTSQPLPPSRLLPVNSNSQTVSSYASSEEEALRLANTGDNLSPASTHVHVPVSPDDGVVTSGVDGRPESGATNNVDVFGSPELVSSSETVCESSGVSVTGTLELVPICEAVAAVDGEMNSSCTGLDKEFEVTFVQPDSTLD